MIKKDEDGVWDISGLVNTLLWIGNIGLIAYMYKDWKIMIFSVWAILPFCSDLKE